MARHSETKRIGYVLRKGAYAVRIEYAHIDQPVQIRCYRSERGILRLKKGTPHLPDLDREARNLAEGRRVGNEILFQLTEGTLSSKEVPWNPPVTVVEEREMVEHPSRAIRAEVSKVGLSWVVAVYAILPDGLGMPAPTPAVSFVEGHEQCLITWKEHLWADTFEDAHAWALELIDETLCTDLGEHIPNVRMGRLGPMTYESFVTNVNNPDPRAAFNYITSFGGYHWIWDVLMSNDGVHNMGFADYIESNEDEMTQIIDGLEAMGASVAKGVYTDALEAYEQGNTERLGELDTAWFGEAYAGFEQCVLDYCRSHTDELYASLTDQQRVPDFRA